MTPVYLLLLPALVYGKIAVYIDVRTDPPLIDVSGYSSVLLPEKERPLYKLEDEQLKNSVANYSKAVPTDVFVRNGWGDLYKNNNGWEEVKRIVKPTLKTKTNTKFSHKCDEIPSESNKNLTILSVWDNTVPTDESIDYQIFQGSNKLSFKSLWGEKIDEFRPISFPMNRNITKCIVHVYLEFESSIFGDVAVNYGAMREGHHFWAFDVNKVQEAVGLPRAQQHRENVTIEYFQ